MSGHRLVLPLAAAAAFAAVPLCAARAETPKLGDLLDGGWRLVGSDFIAAPDVQRAMNNPQWVDDVMLTLQGPTGRIAFCHVPLSVTTGGDAFLSTTCFQPTEAATPPAPGPAKGPAHP